MAGLGRSDDQECSIYMVPAQSHLREALLALQVCSRTTILTKLENASSQTPLASAEEILRGSALYDVQEERRA